MEPSELHQQDQQPVPTYVTVEEPPPARQLPNPGMQSAAAAVPPSYPPPQPQQSPHYYYPGQNSVGDQNANDSLQQQLRFPVAAASPAMFYGHPDERYVWPAKSQPPPQSAMSPMASGAEPMMYGLMGSPMGSQMGGHNSIPSNIAGVGSPSNGELSYQWLNQFADTYNPYGLQHPIPYPQYPLVQQPAVPHLYTNEYHNIPNYSVNVDFLPREYAVPTAPVKRPLDVTPTAQEPKKTKLVPQNEQEFSFHSPPEVMRLRLDAMFTTFAANPTYTGEKFRQFIIEVPKSRYGKYETDEVEAACSVAVKYGSKEFWGTFENQMSFLARLRNWLKEYASDLKSYDRTPNGLKLLTLIPFSVEQLEASKLKAVLNLFAKKGNVQTSKLAIRALKSAKGTEKEEKPAKTALKSNGKPLAKSEVKPVTKPDAPRKPEIKTTVAKPDLSEAGPTSIDRSPKTVVADLTKSLAKSQNNDQTDKTEKSKSVDAPKKMVKSLSAVLAAKKAAPSPAGSNGSGSGFFKSLQTAQKAQAKPSVAKLEPVKPAEKKEAPKPQPMLFSGMMSSLKNQMAQNQKSSTSQSQSPPPDERAPKGKKKKSVQWRDSNLVDIRYFEISEEERVVRKSMDAKKMEYHEALVLEHRGEMNEEVDWYEPLPIDFNYGSNLEPRLREASSIKRAGLAEPKTVEAKIQQEREAHTLVAFYYKEDEIPDSPSEPDLSKESATISPPKIIPIALSLESHPMVKHLSSMNNQAERIPRPSTQLSTAATPQNAQLQALLESLSGTSAPKADPSALNLDWIQSLVQSNNGVNHQQPSSSGILPSANGILPSSSGQLLPPPPPANNSSFPSSSGTVPPPPNSSAVLDLGTLLKTIAQPQSLSIFNFPAANPSVQSSSQLSAERHPPPPDDDATLPSFSGKRLSQERQRDVRQFVRNSNSSELYRQHCRYFTNGKCRKGDGCSYLHIPPP